MEILELINNNGIAALVTYYVIMAIFSTMPDPGQHAGYMIRWAYGAVHLLSANMKSLKESIKPTEHQKPKE